ncbi:MAG TPA: hypothetical protein VHW70_05250 [Edaphobacter sp.]|jgi:hypothetical protein|nr:hypothetical protein [Edaphobacter sp.]
MRTASVEVVNSDQEGLISLSASSDGKDVPVITLVSGPPGLMLLADAPLFKGGMPFSAIAATYAWTPSRADIGTAPAAVFKATTASGASALSTVLLGPVQDVPPGAVSGLTATHVGNRIQVQWSSNSTNPGLAFEVEGCYHTLFPATTIPYLTCELLSTTTTAGADVPDSPVTNSGQPGVPVNYYGIFVTAVGSPNFALLGSGSANVQ